MGRGKQAGSLFAETGETPVLRLHSVEWHFGLVSCRGNNTGFRLIFAHFLWCLRHFLGEKKWVFS